jgi:ribosomal protein S14
MTIRKVTAENLARPSRNQNRKKKKDFTKNAKGAKSGRSMLRSDGERMVRQKFSLSRANFRKIALQSSQRGEESFNDK